jgi:hypothetical protein
LGRADTSEERDEEDLDVFIILLRKIETPDTSNIGTLTGFFLVTDLARLVAHLVLLLSTVVKTLDDFDRRREVGLDEEDNDRSDIDLSNSLYFRRRCSMSTLSLLDECKL